MKLSKNFAKIFEPKNRWVLSLKKGGFNQKCHKKIFWFKTFLSLKSSKVAGMLQNNGDDELLLFGETFWKQFWNSRKFLLRKLNIIIIPMVSPESYSYEI